MNSKDIQSLIAKGKNERLEFASGGSMQPDLIARTVCAFLNQHGGRILLGVRDSGQVQGLSDAEAIARMIESQLGHLISPFALWTAEPARVGDLEIVIVEVPEGMDKPYVTNGGIYSRRDAQTVPASRDEISTLIELRVDASQRWERQIATGAEREDLNDKLVAETALMAAESQRWQGSPVDIDGFLNALGLLTHSGVTNGALLLFGKQPSRLFPQARVRVLVLPEGKTGKQYSVDKLFDGCLLDIVDQVSDSLAAHAGGVSSKFSDQTWQREDRPLYPMTALREGVLNALVHRDYSSTSSVTISILSDSLQISNPGGLPEGLTPADLKRDHLSVPRNPDVAHIFFLRGLIEKIGRGTQRIVEDCRNARLREPKWVSSALETRLTFFSHPSGSPADDLTARQQQILELIKQRKQLHAGELVKLLGSEVTDRTVRNDLHAMVHRGWLVRRGRGRSTSYAEAATAGRK